MVRYRYCQYVKTYITVNCRERRKSKTYITYFHLKNRKLYYIRPEYDTDIIWYTYLVPANIYIF